MLCPETYLARKDPLSTTWIATKLPNQLKQCHYTITKVPSSVKRIMVLMDPPLPGVLSTLPHLLFGVVRIYSKGVEHEYKDIFVVLRKASRAEVQSINVLEMLEDHNRDEDFHFQLQNPEEIVLTDRIPSVHSPPQAHQVEPFANNDYNPGNRPLFSNLEDNDAESNRVLNQTTNENDHVAETILDLDPEGISVPSERGTLDAPDGRGNNSSPLVLIEIPSIPQPQRRGRKRKLIIDEPTVTNRSSYILRKRRNVPSSSLDPEGMSGPSSPQHFDPPTSQGGTSDAQACEENSSPNLICPESPPIQQPQRRGRKRKQFFDETTMLANRSMDPQQAIEIRRDHNNENNLENHQVFQNLQDNDAEPNSGQTTNENNHVSEIIPDLDPEGMSVPSPQHFNPPTPHTPQGGTSDAQARAENNPPNFEVNESPPIQQPQRRGRERRQIFDDPTELPNKCPYKLRKRKNIPSFSLGNRILNGLNDTRDMQRERSDVPSTSSGSRKLNNSRRKHNFNQHLLTGISKDLMKMSKSEYVRSRPHLVISEEDNVDANRTPEEPVDDTNQPLEEPVAATHHTFEEPITATSSVAAFNMEIEHLRNVAVTPPPTIQEHNMVEGDYRSSGRRDDFTMASPHSVSVASLGTNIAYERMQTHLAASPGAHGLETMQAPDSDTHLLISSARTNELWFLTMAKNTQSSSQGTSGSIDRTWNEAQHLERLSSPIMEDDARIFFEVLVLKTNGRVDVQQEEPYGDVSLKLAPTPSNAQS